MEPYPGIICIVGTGQEQIAGLFNWRGEDGVTPLEIVLTAKQQGGDHQNLWKNSCYLPEYKAEENPGLGISSEMLPKESLSDQA
ncbi:uncharacterized protein LOC112179662 isoform X2 [Rosa chinensis]|uniref:uncharacterized protein LOC112179662 isoform X2 n=1 Tax=Rosa chinensis TaxID=74649 RepID=UPI001AD8C6F0|nr:uncharacterized protein LOC112179662 isoform X2 [Rosa chinensis]